MTIYILMSMLLAVVSGKFSDYQKEELISNNKRRELFFLDRFFELRCSAGDFLDRSGMYMFFVMLHDLVEKKKITHFNDLEKQGIQAYFENARRSTVTDQNEAAAEAGQEIAEMQFANPYIKKVKDMTRRSASWLWRSIVDTIN